MKKFLISLELFVSLIGTINVSSLKLYNFTPRVFESLRDKQRHFALFVVSEKSLFAHFLSRDADFSDV